MTAIRRARLEHGARIQVMQGSRLVGLAAYERSDRELRVCEIAVDPTCRRELVEASLLDALELACLAGGARRLVMLPRATSDTEMLSRHGFHAIAEGCAGTWFEKTVA
jgi:N-acetylglutamate synthase-like GNAT family acetyltransferase